MGSWAPESKEELGNLKVVTPHHGQSYDGPNRLEERSKTDLRHASDFGPSAQSPRVDGVVPTTRIPIAPSTQSSPDQRESSVDSESRRTIVRIQSKAHHAE